MFFLRQCPCPESFASSAPHLSFPCISLVPVDGVSVWIDAIQGKEVEIIQEPALIERNFGVFEGKPFDDLVEAEVSSGKGFGMVGTYLFLSNNNQYPKYVNF